MMHSILGIFSSENLIKIGNGSAKLYLYFLKPIIKVIIKTKVKLKSLLTHCLYQRTQSIPLKPCRFRSNISGNHVGYVVKIFDVYEGFGVCKAHVIYQTVDYGDDVVPSEEF